ncbi:MAG: hypothetical protein EGQ20_01395 [Bacteroides oleiciplenus]|nr:hypothetical protein [Bacteroides oleiciplenus]
MKKIALVLMLAVLSAMQSYAQKDSTAMNYRRSSLYSLLINHDDQKFAREISDVFLQIPTPDKYNNHDLSVKVVSMGQKLKDTQVVDEFVKNNGIASRMVSRWFNRDPLTGVCDVELVKERGLYDASEFDKELAARSQRGMAMLEDAGEDLIGNSFLVVNDIRYIDREKTGKAFGTAFRILGAVADVALGTNSFSDLGDSMGDMMETLKGFKVNVITHLYQLVWDEETAMTFYRDYYSTDSDQAKKQAFDNHRSKFSMKYIGMQKSSGKDVSFLGVNLDEPKQMIRKACQRAIDENIASLQQNFEAFKVKTPLTEVEPICAQIGMKEGITEKSRFEVLEAVMKDNKVEYKKVGEIKPVSGMIWDNRYMAKEEGAAGAELGQTTFKKVSGRDFYPGMLIREIK